MEVYPDIRVRLDSESLVFVAKDIEADDIVEYLARDGDVRCEPAARARVAARSDPDAAH